MKALDIFNKSELELLRRICKGEEVNTEKMSSVDRNYVNYIAKKIGKVKKNNKTCKEDCVRCVSEIFNLNGKGS